MAHRGKLSALNNLPDDKKAELLRSNEDVQGYELTDTGNAQRLVSRHGKDLRYCRVWGKWLVFDGQRWAKDETGAVNLMAIKTARSIHAEAAQAITKELAWDLSQHARRSESLAKIKGMVELAQSLPGVPVIPEQLDTDPWLLNVQNGTLNLKTGELMKHRQGDLITKLAPVKHDPDAKCPTWDSFLKRIMADNEELISFLQLAVGYAMTGSTREQVLFFLYGNGANGKSTFLNTIEKMLGDYAMHTPTDTLMVKQHDGIPNDIARLKGARFIAAVESEEGKRMAESLVKQMTGGDKISARFMRGEWFDFMPSHKIFIGTNHKPVIKGTDNAIWRRIRLIPFSVTLPEEEWDRELPGKLEAELSGILNWALEGCIAWQAVGLKAPKEVTAATEDYRAEMDSLAGFIEECCIVKDYAKIPAGNIYAAYIKWCEDNGEKAESQKRLGMRLSERGFQRIRGLGGRYLWGGICLRDDETMNDQ